MSGCDRVLVELRTGPKTAAELYARTFTVLHSRISDLRRAGCVISCERIEGDGAAGYLYTLMQDRPAGPGADVAGLHRATERAACPPQRQPLVQAAQQLSFDGMVAA